jgi:hypothetical protein
MFLLVTFGNYISKILRYPFPYGSKHLVLIFGIQTSSEKVFGALGF